jgi:hypothetical protein
MPVSVNKKAIKMLTEQRAITIQYLNIYKADKNEDMVKSCGERLAVGEYLLGLCEKDKNNDNG